MNDPQIRNAFHSSFLREHHDDPNTLVVNELGLEHGTCRADIAVISNSLLGFEIKSDVDSLKRLSAQLISYDAVFDRSFVILTCRHVLEATRIVPEWWGIILAEEITHKIQFSYLRPASKNNRTNSYAIAQLLWRDEAQDILMKLGVRGQGLRKSRALLYGDIINLLTPVELRLTVREYLMKRRGWRDHVSPSLYDDLSRPHETEIVLQV